MKRLLLALLVLGGAQGGFAQQTVNYNQPARSTAAWTSGTSSNTALTVSVQNLSTMTVALNATSTMTGGVLTFERSDTAAGTTWYGMQCSRDGSAGTADVTFTLSVVNQSWSCPVAGWNQFRVRLSTVITGSGTANVAVYPTASPVTSVASVGVTNGSLTVTDGTTITAGSSNVAQTASVGYAFDGTADRRLQSDTSGNLKVVSSGGTFTEVTGTANSAAVLSNWPVDVSQYKWFTVQTTGSFSATVVVEFSNDNTTYYIGYANYNAGGAGQNGSYIATSIGVIGLINGPIQGRYMRIRISTYGSGTVTAIAELYTVAAATTAVSVQGYTPTGSAPVSNPLYLGGTDGSVIRALGVDGNGAATMNVKEVNGNTVSTATTGTQLVGVTGHANGNFDAATGAVPPANVLYLGGLQSGATGGHMGGLTICDSDYVVNISTATTTLAITGVSGRQVRICAINLVAGAAQNTALIEGTGGTCGSGTAGMTGGTTAASGWNFAANGGISQGSGLGEVITTATTGDSVCIVTSAAAQLSGHIKYTIY